MGDWHRGNRRRFRPLAHDLIHALEQLAGAERLAEDVAYVPAGGHLLAAELEALAGEHQDGQEGGQAPFVRRKAATLVPG